LLTDGRSRGRAARWCDRVAAAAAGLLRMRVLLAMPSRALGVRCGARLGRAGPRLAALRSESNLHPDVPTGPTPPCSPPFITALWQVRGSIWTIVGAAGGGVGGNGTLQAGRRLLPSARRATLSAAADPRDPIYTFKSGVRYALVWSSRVKLYKVRQSPCFLTYSCGVSSCLYSTMLLLSKPSLH
jgi:hypothetical protein